MTRWTAIIGIVTVVLLIIPLEGKAEDRSNDGLRIADLLQTLVTVDGYVKNETAFRINAPHQFTKAQNFFQAELTAPFSSSLELTLIGRASYDPVNKLEVDKDFDADPLDRFEAGRTFEAELREAYVDISWKDIDLRLGRQQVVWGKADGLRILDIINPQEFREFILDDFEDSRIPLWLLRLDYYLGDISIQGLWIPDFEANRLADPGSEFAFAAPAIPTDVPVLQVATQEPADGIEDSELGVRISGFTRGWDWTLNYFYTWTDFPILFPVSTRGAETLSLSPRHTRQHVVGTTFSNAFGPAVLRGEFGYLFDTFFQTKLIQEGPVEKDYINYVLGVDYTLLANCLVSGQFFQQIIVGYDDSIASDGVQNSLSLLVRTDFLNQTLKPEILILYGADNGDWLLRPKVSYDLTDTTKITLGSDIFAGDPEGFFGQFHGKDRVYLEVKYSF